MVHLECFLERGNGKWQSETLAGLLCPCKAQDIVPGLDFPAAGLIEVPALNIFDILYCGVRLSI